MCRFGRFFGGCRSGCSQHSNLLYIYGDPGLGKTHIAQAIGMEAKQRRASMQVALCVDERTGAGWLPVRCGQGEIKAEFYPLLPDASTC
ncbi:MAG: DnaA ATPase domain-containing protein [Alistipes indistinctus]